VTDGRCHAAHCLSKEGLAKLQLGVVSARLMWPLYPLHATPRDPTFALSKIVGSAQLVWRTTWRRSATSGTADEERPPGRALGAAVALLRRPAARAPVLDGGAAVPGQ
jgi:hypothetical protein